jgi:exodeoxyribonuclease VII large subunit
MEELDFPSAHGWDAVGREIVSVSDLTRCIRLVIESEEIFQNVWVRGEISNLTKHSSGHIYFCLKDEFALIRCVIWNNQRPYTVRFELDDGMSVIVHGRVTVYEKGGQYQLVVTDILPGGVGTLYAALERLKERLRAEGLFETSRKIPIPKYPKKIAIITSPTGAALRDMVTIARRRMPSVDLLVIPTLMQGDGSEVSVVQSLQLADNIDDVDVIVVGRGGGSIEDLWTFNTESVVRAIAECTTPVVSAIGHETDYTLSDMAADLRAPTPSAAMELILPDKTDLTRRIDSMCKSLIDCANAFIEHRRKALEMLCSSRCMRFPYELIESRFQTLDIASERLGRNFQMMVSGLEAKLLEVAAKLDSLSPIAVLSRGYAIVRQPDEGTIISNISEVALSQTVETMLSNGSFLSEVKEIREGLHYDGRAKNNVRRCND